MARIVLDDLNLEVAEKTLIVEALNLTGSLIDAAQLLGITTRQLSRKMVHHRIEWPRAPSTKS